MPKDKRAHHHYAEKRKLIGERIAQIRRERGLTQTQLVSQLSHPRTDGWLSRIESGESNPTPPELFEIADILRVDPLALSDPDYDEQRPLPRQPRTIQDWKRLYPDDELRAQAHFNVDRTFQ